MPCGLSSTCSAVWYTKRHTIQCCIVSSGDVVKLQDIVADMYVCYVGDLIIGRSEEWVQSVLQSLPLPKRKLCSAHAG